MSKKLIAVSMLSLVAGVCFYGNHLSAWERHAMNDCKHSEKDCKSESKKCNKKDGSCKEMSATCKEDYNECKADAKGDDMSSFKYHLSPYSKSLFENFTPKQREKAMDLADKNKMSPDDAVMKVNSSN